MSMSKFSKIPSQLKLKDFIFIVGRGRSGTTLLRSMLNCNSNVMIAPESLFLMHSLKKYKKQKWDMRTIKSFNNDIWQEGRLKNWGLNKIQTEKFLLKNAINKDYKYAISLIYYLYAIKNRKYLIRILGDKNPLYSLFLEDLLKIFPNSKIVHLVRDCRSNIASFKNVKFDSNNTATLAYRWKRFNQEILNIKHIQKSKIITIKYEKLLSDTQSELKKICKFLNIRFSKKMLVHHKFFQVQNLKWHKNLSNPVNKMNINNWKKNLSKTDLITIKKICGKSSQRFKYNLKKKNNTNLNFLEKIGIFNGWLRTELEIIFFKIPIKLRFVFFLILHFYRSFTLK